MLPTQNLDIQYSVRQKRATLIIAPQAAFHSCSGTFVTDRAGVQPIGCTPA